MSYPFARENVPIIDDIAVSFDGCSMVDTVGYY